MPTLAAIQYLGMIFKLGGEIFHLVPIHVHFSSPSYRFAVNWKHKRSKQIAWLSFLTVSLLLTIFEISVYFGKAANAQLNLLFIIFHGVWIVSKLSLIACFAIFTRNTLEVCHFFNCILRRPKGLVGSHPLYAKSWKSESNGIWFLVEIVTFSVASLLTFSVLIPIASIIFPSLHKHFPFFSKFCAEDEGTNLVRVYVALTQISQAMPFGLLAMLTVAAALMAMDEVRGNLIKLRNVTRTTKYSRNEEELLVRIASVYRQIQVLVIISNQCFQTFIWPTFQFGGAVFVILLLYPLLALNNEIPKILQFGMAFFIADIGLIVCITMDLGSQTIIYSTAILKDVRSGKCFPWSLRFFRSCPPIMMSVGEFHKMDRARVAAFIRFILQRTFFLVLKTKTDTFRYKFSVSLPN